MLVLSLLWALRDNDVFPSRYGEDSSGMSLITLGRMSEFSMQVNSSWVTSDVRSSTSVHKVARPEPPSEESQRTEKEL